ncbi:Detected protein of unknown function [Hibiscus syriacus]|uniref:Leucine-rich repeat-containing N-terminal plant-type domain-containing protein n=1 Tax=Hibiscus syriacus TaxID=106335 RepID=A0A6A2YQS0_HIBSY|nr:Detected protein of unknown function [Hibiscus syriacus]
MTIVKQLGSDRNSDGGGVRGREGEARLEWMASGKLRSHTAAGSWVWVSSGLLVSGPIGLRVVVMGQLGHFITCSAGTQAEALIRWKNTLLSSSPSLNSWSLSNLNNLCDWTSITCDDATATVSQINLFNSDMSGSISQFNFTPFTSLTRFDLKNNTMDGPIPASIGTLSKLLVLDLSSNSFQGELPVEMGGLRELQYLSLSNNNLSGAVPPEVSNLQNVRHLDLGHNYFVSSDWSGFLSMPSLTYLSLANNALESEFRRFIFDYREIPLELGNLSLLFNLYLRQNRLTGEIPVELDNCEKLLSLNLSHNILSGEIPSELGSLSALQFLLDLSSNSLSGSIPQDLRKLVSLENLNVSHNGISGRIPTSLSSMISLQKFDFSYNELTGPIPSDGVFEKASGNAFVGNPGLCGDVDGLIPCSLSPINNRRVLLIAILVPICGILTPALIAAGVIVHCRRQNRTLDEEIKVSKKTEFSESSIWGSEGKFTLGDIERATEGFNKKYLIGKGGFASVCGAELPSGQVVASLHSQCGSQVNVMFTASEWWLLTKHRKIMMGKHPGELLSSVTPLSDNKDLYLKDLLDQRLPLPSNRTAHKVASVFAIGLACKRPVPDSGPAMRSVAQQLSTRNQPCLGETLRTTTISSLISFGR